MPLATKIYWFYRDNCCSVGTIPQIKSKLNDPAFVGDILTDLFNTAARCQHDIAKLGDPADLDGFDQILYDDHIELYNRAVDLYNNLMDRGIDIIA